MSSSNQAQDKGKGKVVGGRTKSKSVKRSQEEVYLAAFKECEFVQTKWAHKGTLEILGLLEDVTTIMENIGIQNILDMDYLAYPEETAHLMASFEIDIKKSNSPPPIEELGCVRFKVKGRNYELSMKDLCLAYGFKLDHGGKKANFANADYTFWGYIGHGSFKGSKVKAATIGNPSIRYVHKLISQTIFARHEADKVKEDELALLVNGLKPMYKDLFEHEKIYGYESLNVGLLLAKQIRKIKQEWVLKQPTGAKVYIGGFLTPILLACKVPLGTPSESPRNYLDLNNLVRIHFLSGRLGDDLVYNFTTPRGENGRVQLPNQSITKLISLENLRFRPAESDLLEEPIDPESSQRRKRGKSAQGESSTQGGSSKQEIPLGSPRYYHPRYEGRVTGGVKHALDGVEKNQRRGKWLSKSLHNVTKGFKKEIKSLKSTVSDLKSIVETFVLRRHSLPRGEDGSTSYEAALEVVRRNSISHPPSFEEAEDREGPRPSSYERRQRRRRHRHIPTPSPPSSDNELYHLSDSYSEG